MFPTTTFANNHLLGPMVCLVDRAGSVNSITQQGAGANWAAPMKCSVVADLQEAVKNEDWEARFGEGLTMIHMQANWSAGAERCSLLQSLAASSQAKNVLEVGSFCGAAALALAEALPRDGQVLSLEFCEYSVELGKRFRDRSAAGGKIKYNMGFAGESIERLRRSARVGNLKKFDMVLIDADKDGMRDYFDTIWGSPDSPGLVTENAIVCVDVTPHKGQPPVRYVKYGFPYRWQNNSGQAEIDALRQELQQSDRFVCNEFGGLLIVKQKSL
jgi:predicted O-methyltransferase YrrM